MRKCAIVAGAVLVLLQLAFSGEKTTDNDLKVGMTLRQAHALHMLFYKHIPNTVELTLEGFLTASSAGDWCACFRQSLTWVNGPFQQSLKLMTLAFKMDCRSFF